ncbi:MAG TPA: DUF488 family protein [Candidatus Thermoplasmatota archaeon]|nr:DUF488 family protein [Candidatus Thermoplasmatota archaeon]
MIKIKRAYNKPSKDDGFRILIDQLWPRGLTKEKAAIDCWLKEIAPSTALRQWFSHDPVKWNEFRRKYLKELKEKEDMVNEIDRLAREKKTVTLVFAAKDEQHNNAVVLEEVLQQRGGRRR